MVNKRYLTQLADHNLQSAHNAPYQAWKTVRLLVATEIDRLCYTEVTQPITWYPEDQTTFFQKIHGFLRLRIDHWKHNIVAINDSYLLLRIDDGIHSLNNVHIVLTQTFNWTNWHLKVDCRDCKTLIFTNDSACTNSSSNHNGWNTPCHSPESVGRLIIFSKMVVVTSVRWGHRCISENSQTNLGNLRHVLTELQNTIVGMNLKSVFLCKYYQ